MPSVSLKEIVIVYLKVKELIILAENIDKEKRLPLNSVNELRNAFDHLMRVIGHQEEVDSMKEVDITINMQQITEHIYRAGYDACDVIAINLFENIEQILSPYDSEVIVKVLPNFYQEIYPRLQKLQNEIRKAKTIKGTLEESFSVEYFAEYDNVIQEVFEIKESLESNVLALSKIKKEHENKSIKNNILNVVIALVSLVIGWLLS